MCMYVCVSWGGGCLSIPSPHIEKMTSTLGGFISLQKVGKEEPLGWRGGCDM